MGFIAGRKSVTTAVQATGTIPTPGNAAASAITGPTFSPSSTATATLSFGIGTGKVNVFCFGEYTIAASSSLTLNLYDGGTTINDLTTLFGDAANLRICRSISFLISAGGDSDGVTVGAASSNVFSGFFGDSSDVVDIYPDGPALTLGSPAGVTVTSTTKNIKIANNSTTEDVTVQVFADGSAHASGEWSGFLLWSYA